MNNRNSYSEIPQDSPKATDQAGAKGARSGWLFGAVAAGLTAGLILVGVLVLNGCMYYGAQASTGSEATYAADEYPVLDQYGEWAEIWPYGRVWRPHVVADWQPFCYGDWMWSQDGWTWSSYEPFGWVVYHYGEWNFDPDFGWYWIPGTDWSPARVDWVTYGDYVCWAPMAASGVTWQEPWEDRDDHVWSTVEAKDFLKENVGHSRVMGERPESTPEKAQMRVAYKAPERKMIQERIPDHVERVNLAHEKVVVGPRKLLRARMPEIVQQRVERNRAIVEREVLRNEPLKPVPAIAAQPRILSHSNSGKNSSSSKRKP